MQYGRGCDIGSAGARFGVFRIGRDDSGADTKRNSRAGEVYARCGTRVPGARARSEYAFGWRGAADKASNADRVGTYGSAICAR